MQIKLHHFHPGTVVDGSELVEAIGNLASVELDTITWDFSGVSLDGFTKTSGFPQWQLLILAENPLDGLTRQRATIQSLQFALNAPRSEAATAQLQDPLLDLGSDFFLWRFLRPCAL
jgi:hypothetical protein